MNSLLHIDLRISDSLKIVRKSVLIYETIIDDLDAVEKAVIYDYINGFVEGTNSRLKMIKCTMYGKCDKELLEAKFHYMKQEKTDNCRSARDSRNNQNVSIVCLNVGQEQSVLFTMDKSVLMLLCVRLRRVAVANWSTRRYMNMDYFF